MEQPLIENKSPKEQKKGKAKAQNQNQGSKSNKRIIRKLIVVSILALIFMGAEVAGGIIAGSIAIMSDAAHMLSDFLGFMISIVSVYISGFPATKKYSFGYHRAGVIGALTSVIVIWVLSGFLIYYAIQRIIHIDEVEVEGFIMFGVSCFGLVTNFIMIWILHSGEHSHGGPGHNCGGHSHKHGENGDHAHIHDHSHSHDHKHDDKNHNHNHKHDHTDVESPNPGQNEQREQDEKIAPEPIGRDAIYIFGSEVSQRSIKPDEDKENLNVKATMLHIFGDILQSIGVIISSTLIWQWPDKFKLADPIITLVFAFIVLVTTLKIVGACMYILMEGTPKEIDCEELEARLKEVEGVVELHDIHVWSLNIGKNAMAVHIRVRGDPEVITRKVKAVCRKYKILHVTIQTEIARELGDSKLEPCKQDIHWTLDM